MVENQKVRGIRLRSCLELNPRSMPLGMVKKLTRAKVCVFTCPLDIAQTETKGTVLLKNAEEMLNFTRGEEQHLEIVIPPFPHLDDTTHPKS